METLLQSISNCVNFRGLKRYIRKHLYAYPQQGRYVTLTTLKSSKTISLDVEENLKERASKHHKDQTDTFDIEEKFNEFAKKLDLVVDQLTALKNQQLSVDYLFTEANEHQLHYSCHIDHHGIYGRTN